MLPWLLMLIWSFTPIHALPFFDNSTIPPNLTVDCAKALLTDVVQCPPTVASFSSGYYYPPTILEEACTSACSSALQLYEQTIITACADQTWAAYDEVDDAPLAMIPHVMGFNHDLVCLRDSGRWCNVVAAAAAVQADPGRESQLFRCYNLADQE